MTVDVKTIRSRDVQDELTATTPMLRRTQAEVACRAVLSSCLRHESSDRCRFDTVDANDLRTFPGATDGMPSRSNSFARSTMPSLIHSSQHRSSVFSTHPSPRSVKTDCRWLSNKARAFWRFFSALALAVAMPSKASSRMATMRCCSGSGGTGIMESFCIALDADSIDCALQLPVDIAQKSSSTVSK